MCWGRAPRGSSSAALTSANTHQYAPYTPTPHLSLCDNSDHTKLSRVIPLSCQMPGDTVHDHLPELHHSQTTSLDRAEGTQCHLLEPAYMHYITRKGTENLNLFQHVKK